MELLIAFVVGLVVMDLLWAQWKYRRALKKNPNYSEWSED
jgi:heme/copper-type cytochrome/quinol oxidase subunit 2